MRQLAIELLIIVEDEQPIFLATVVEEGFVIVLRSDVVGSNVSLSLFRIIVGSDKHLFMINVVPIRIYASGTPLGRSMARLLGNHSRLFLSHPGDSCILGQNALADRTVRTSCDLSSWICSTF